MTKNIDEMRHIDPTGLLTCSDEEAMRRLNEDAKKALTEALNVASGMLERLIDVVRAQRAEIAALKEEIEHMERTQWQN